MGRIVRFIKHEFSEIFPVTIFFLIGFNLIAFSKHLMLLQEGIVYDGILAATVGALIIAKVVLVANKLPFMRISQGRPLYRPILFQTVVYTFFALAVRGLETLVRNALRTDGLISGLAADQAEFVWEHFVVVQIWVFVLFLAYVTLIQLKTELGHGSLSEMLFSRGRS